ncbi:MULTISPECIES: hypothetical protein [unclassified Microbacterium]|uniref:hypothetical protein n=1 Tax=unclassified Microbacterium TaxID=2609290 RepID=UPI00301B554A
MTTSAGHLLLDEPGALRRLGADEAPYPGRLHAGDPPTVWVDPALMPEAVWARAGDRHLLAPTDLARVVDGTGEAGHAAVIPHCPHRLGALLRDDVTAGEAITIAVSMLRAAQEARSARITAGTWWVDASGRPVLAAVVRAGRDTDWSREGAHLLERLAAGAPASCEAAITAAAGLLRAERAGADEVAACEERLFALAAPAPLRMPEPGTGATAGPSRADVGGRGSKSPVTVPRDVASSVVGSWIATFVGSEWAERVHGAVAGVRAAVRTAAPRRGGASGRERTRGRRTRRARSDAGTARAAARSRGRPWVVAAALAVAIVLAGLLWPSAIDGSEASGMDAAQDAGERTAGPGEGGASGDGAPPTDALSIRPTAPEPDPARDPEADSDPVPQGGEAEPSDLEAAARAVLSRLSECVEPEECAEILESPERAGGAATLAADLRREPRDDGTVPDAETSLIDEYGGVAVFRVKLPGGRSRVLALVRVDAKWLVRDVYDVADQP